MIRDEYVGSWFKTGKIWTVGSLQGIDMRSWVANFLVGACMAFVGAQIIHADLPWTQTKKLKRLPSIPEHMNC